MTGPGRPVVTFYEEYGAGAGHVAPRVAELLGVPYLSQRFGSDELEDALTRDDDSFLGRLLASFTPAAETDADLTWAMDALADGEAVAGNTRAVLESVVDGGVIFGRSATAILARRPGTLHVKLIGPVADRVARAASEAGIPIELAQRRQAREDRLRVELSKRHYRWDPTEDRHFDLVLNTGTFSLDQAVDLVVAAYRRRYAP